VGPRSGHILLILAASLAGAGLWAGPPGTEYLEHIEEVFLTEAGALKLAFPGADKVESRARRFTAEERSRIEERLGWALSGDTVTVHQGFKDGGPQGRAVVMEEIGKFKPITFMVKASNDGKVERVDVMVYRESVGAEVRRARFTRQFRGKTTRDPLRINRDILNVTGATMSVQAVTAGVKKALVILETLDGR